MSRAEGFYVAGLLLHLERYYMLARPSSGSQHDFLAQKLVRAHFK